MAAPAPCITRAATSAAAVLLSAAAVEPAVKTKRPAQNTLRRPKRSPRAAPVRSKHAKARL